MKSGIKVAVLGGLALAVGSVAFRAQADTWDKKTIFTLTEGVQIQDTYLEPGTYVFKLANSSSNRNIVMIYNEDQNHLIKMIMAIPNYRLQPPDKTRFTYYETPLGSAKAMRAWFYPGDNYGQEFRYPKQLRQIAVIVKKQTLTATAEPAPPVVTEPESAPPPVVTETAQQAINEEAKEEVRQEETVVIAQNNPPPPPPAVEVTPAPAPLPAEVPAELPKTATPFPMIGLGGLLSLAGYGLLRLRNMA